MKILSLTRKNGTDTLSLTSTLPVIKVESAEQSREILNEDKLTLSVLSEVPVDFRIGDYMDAFGRRYTINQLPESVHHEEYKFSYNVVLEGMLYELLRPQFLNTDVSGFNTTGDFTLTGTCAFMAGLIISNAERVFGSGSWILGDSPVSDTRTLTFSGSPTLGALQQLCREFGVEYDIELSGSVRVLNIREQSRILPDAFKYGQEGGLYDLSRQTVKEKDIVTRLYAFGGTRNLKAGYRNFSPRLRMNDAGYVENPDAVAAFGIIEGTVIWEDIYPHRIGTVTSLGADELTFVDTSMDFDLNAADGSGNTLYLLAGSAAKIHFNTGNLAGYEFEIQSYNHATKTFVIKPFTDSQQFTFPSPDTAAFQMQSGDKYVLLDINMPQGYIDAAEGTLNTRAASYLQQYSAPTVTYSVTVDEPYLSAKYGTEVIVNVFELGDVVTIQDTALNIDGSTRILSFVRDILRPYRYILTLGDTVEVSERVRILAEQIEQRKIMRINQLTDPAKARRSYRTTQELLGLVFDTDGYFDTSKIKAGTIETAMLAVGIKSQQFILQDLVIQPNYQGQKNTVRSSGGSLIHYSLEETIRTWNLTSGTYGLGNDNPYYIYAKCNRLTSTGSIVFSQIQRKFDADPTDYYFLVGVLHSVSTSDGVRQISLTYGSTTINGRWIKTGVISSADGETRFDLDNGEIVGTIKFKTADGSYQDLADLTLPDIDSLNQDLVDLSEALGLLQTSDSSQATSIASLFGTVSGIQTALADIQQQVDNQFEIWTYEGAPTLSNLPAVNWTDDATKDSHLYDVYYNTLDFTGYRFIKTGSVYSWEPITDSLTLELLQRISEAEDLIDQKRRVFVTASGGNPTPPYEAGDLWTDGQQLRRCVTPRLAGQSYVVNDWVLATYYDNTVTTINGGIVTSGRIQLAGSGGSILAGITGEGTADSSIRLWAGASYENRAFAPFRVNQGGEMWARKRIEMMNENNQGQAGIAGANTSGDGPVRMWAGSNYEGRNSAPFRVNSDGSMYATLGKIGDWTISGSGIINENGAAYIIARKIGTNNKFTEARIGANVFPATFGGKGASYFEATEESIFEHNYAIYSKAAGGIQNYNFYGAEGVTHSRAALLNGRASRDYELTNGTAIVFDPSLYDFLNIFPNLSGARYIKLSATPSQPIADGKEVTVFNRNDAKNDFYIYETIRGVTNFQVNGGNAVTLFYVAPYWYVKSVYDNNW